MLAKNLYNDNRLSIGQAKYPKQAHVQLPLEGHQCAVTDACFPKGSVQYTEQSGIEALPDDSGQHGGELPLGAQSPFWDKFVKINAALKICQQTHQQPFYDTLINAEVELQSGELMKTEKVIGISVNHEGATNGSCDDNLC